MALRHIWFLFSLAVAVAAAIFSPNLMPSFIDWATGVNTALFDSLFRNDDLLRIATAIAVGALVLFLLFYLGLSIFDGINVTMARRGLQSGLEATGDVPPSDFQSTMENHSALEGPSANFVSALQEISMPTGSGKSTKTVIASMRPAHHFFGPHATIHARSYRWLFDPLPVLLLAIGTGLLMLKAASALGQRSGPSIAEMLGPQFAGLLLLTTAALLIYVIKRIVLGIRYQQIAAFCEFVDSLYPLIGEIEHLNRLETVTREASKSIVTAVNSIAKDLSRTLDAKLKDWQKISEKSQKDMQDALVSGLEGALKPPIATLVKASEKTGQDIAVQSRDALDAVLNTFLGGLQQTFGKQTKDLKSTLEETEKAAKDMQKAYRDSLDLHHKSVQDNLEAYAGSFGQTAASFEALQGAVDNLLTITTPLLRQMISHQEGLLNALEQESASSKVIGRAASELSLAAQASRDTVEQFVTLAERLRETSKSMGAAGGNAAARGADKELVKQLRALKSEVGDATDQ